jgi:hypothetical protein
VAVSTEQPRGWTVQLFRTSRMWIAKRGRALSVRSPSFVLGTIAALLNVRWLQNHVYLGMLISL